MWWSGSSGSALQREAVEVRKSRKLPGSETPVDDKAKSREEILAELNHLRVEMPT